MHQKTGIRIAVLSLLAAVAATAQSINSGSTGVDGALNLVFLNRFILKVIKPQMQV